MGFALCKQEIQIVQVLPYNNEVMLFWKILYVYTILNSRIAFIVLFILYILVQNIMCVI